MRSARSSTVSRSICRGACVARIPPPPPPRTSLPCHACPLPPPPPRHIPPTMHTPLPRTPPPRGQNSWHMFLKILPCPNFVAGGKYIAQWLRQSSKVFFSVWKQTHHNSVISVMISLVLTNLESDSGCLLVLLMNRRFRMILLNFELVLRARKRYSYNKRICIWHSILYQISIIHGSP